MKFSLAVFFATAISACALQEAPDSTGFGTIAVTAEAVQEKVLANVPETKTTLSGVETLWVEGRDKIGIFSPHAKATSDGTPEANPAKNLAFTAQASAKRSSFSGSLYWGSESMHNFYAYYPYDSEYSADETAVPIFLPSAQSQSAAGNSDHIGALDYMVATPDTVTAGGAVNLSFNHVFSMIEFQIIGNGTLSDVRLNGVDPLACEGTIDLTQNPGADPYSITTSSTSNNVSVTLGSGVSLSSEKAVSLYIMILPGAQSEDMNIALKIDGKWKALSKTPPTDGFSRGKKYRVSLDAESEEWNDAIEDPRDQRLYKLITIGSQVWMTENMAYLPLVESPSIKSDETSCYYVSGYEGTDVSAAKATTNYQTYGVLYNWPAAQTACPERWHLPSDEEWTQLETYLANNGFNYDGTTGPEFGDGVRDKIAKSMATDSGWDSSLVEGAAGNTDYPEYKNKSGFSALPGGFFGHDGFFYGIGDSGFWWSATADGTDSARFRWIDIDEKGVLRDLATRRIGFAVRCIKD
ncbi:MAG TPA: FISUMP domain-containing protein [Desulfobacteraceae bacterium]|nr:FISUMP domain-containing protein [Desulfobacteraceae bacterium]